MTRDPATLTAVSVKRLGRWGVGVPRNHAIVDDTRVIRGDGSTFDNARVNELEKGAEGADALMDSTGI
jgi:hypothetical protein